MTVNREVVQGPKGPGSVLVIDASGRGTRLDSWAAALVAVVVVNAETLNATPVGRQALDALWLAVNPTDPAQLQ